MLLLTAALPPAASAQGMQFRDITADSALQYETQPVVRFAVSVADFDLDGWLDVCFTGSDRLAPRIFRNNGDRTFTDVSSAVLPLDANVSKMALFVDLDDDGWPDLAAARSYTGTNATSFQAYRNVQAVFEPIDQPPELAHHVTSVGSISWGDMDGDNDLDLFFLHNGGGGGNGGPGFFLRNDGTGRFADDTALFAPALLTTRRYWATVLVDFDADGWLNLHSAIDAGPDFHARNVAGTRLEDASGEAGVSNVGSDMGLAVGDPDLDGDFDLYSTNINYGVLYINDGHGHFTNQASQRGVGTYGTFSSVIGWGTAFVDFDDDMDEDLVFVAQNQPGRLYRNNGTGYFTDATAGSGLFLLGVGLVPFDFDRDGDLDLLATDQVGAPRFFENVTDRDGRHWLNVRLVGRRTNSAGIGAGIEAVAGGKRQWRVMAGAYSFVTGPPPEVHLGLGANSTAESLLVRWPSGAEQLFTDVPADRLVTVYEPRCDGACSVGDLDGDCAVDLADLATLLTHFSSTAAEMPDGDLNLDSVVDLADLQALLEHFGQNCSQG